MAYRNLTDVFVIMRSRNTFFENMNQSDDRQALVVGTDKVKYHQLSEPDWIQEVDEIQFEITKLKNKLKELALLHDKHLNRPTFDDNADEEQIINAQTQTITQGLNQCQLKIQKLSIKTRNSRSFTKSTDTRLTKSVVSNLASSLQDITTDFRKGQNAYLKKIQSRKERSNMLFDTSQYAQSNSAFMTEENDFGLNDNFNNQAINKEQMMIVRQNEKVISERETEITHIVQSIQDLNELFKDLATMVVDQGTVLDRIDCNIERMSHSVEHGLVELEKAAKYQKSSKKMLIITILMIIFIVLFILLVLIKF